MSSKAQKYRMNVREFLNLPGHESSAHIIAQVVDTRGQKYPSMDIVLDIADCSRKIGLNFYMHDEETAKNAMHKINLLIDQLNEFRKHLNAERILMLRRLRKQEKEKELRMAKRKG